MQSRDFPTLFRFRECREESFLRSAEGTLTPDMFDPCCKRVTERILLEASPGLRCHDTFSKTFRKKVTEFFFLRVSEGSPPRDLPNNSVRKFRPRAAEEKRFVPEAVRLDEGEHCCSSTCKQFQARRSWQ